MRLAVGACHVLTAVLVVALTGCSTVIATPGRSLDTTPSGASPTSLFVSTSPSLPSPRPHRVFTLTGTLPADQDYQPVSILADGRVFLIGPYADSAEIFDPNTDVFSPRAMPAMLYDYSFVALGDGRLLGLSPSGRGAVRFDPAAGSVTATGPMVIDQQGAQATVLADGRVLFTGGTDSQSRYLRSAQIYDPSSGRFSTTGSMHVAREQQRAALLADGRVLVAGGDQGDAGSQPVVLSSAEVYDPAKGSFATTGPMLESRAAFGAVLLADGAVLIVGGEGIGRDGQVDNLASAELYSASSGTFRKTHPMLASRVAFGIVRLLNGDVLITGGTDPDGVALATAELYNPPVASFSSAGPMNFARVPYLMLLRGGRVLITGGATGTGQTPSELYWP
jgi:hypothetical protein